MVFLLPLDKNASVECSHYCERSWWIIRLKSTVAARLADTKPSLPIIPPTEHKSTEYKHAVLVLVGEQCHPELVGWRQDTARMVLSRNQGR